MGTVYKKSGVDRQAAQEWVSHLQRYGHRTADGPCFQSDIGHFASRYQTYGDAQLLSAADGVGTKLWLAETETDFYHLGVDLVAACTNDLAVYAARPLFFLDYLSIVEYDWTCLSALFEGIVYACQTVGCRLVGGETAQLPQKSTRTIQDMCGFAVGLCESTRQPLDGRLISPGDCVLSLPANGFHANGFSLIRFLLDGWSGDCHEYRISGDTLHQILMRPTRLYSPCVQTLVKHLPIHAMANITGGGLFENIKRVLRTGLQYVPDLKTYVLPEEVSFFQKTFALTAEDIWDTWNCGIGFVCILPERYWSAYQDILDSYGMPLGSHIGYIEELPFDMVAEPRK